MGGSYGLSLIRATLSGSAFSRGTHSVAFNGLPIKTNDNEKRRTNRTLLIMNNPCLSRNRSTKKRFFTEEIAKKLFRCNLYARAASL